MLTMDEVRSLLVVSGWLNYGRCSCSFNGFSCLSSAWLDISLSIVKVIELSGMNVQGWKGIGMKEKRSRSKSEV